QLVGHRRQVVGEPAGLHVAVVRADALRGRQATVARGKLRLLAAPPRSGTFKVDQSHSSVRGWAGSVGTRRPSRSGLVARAKPLLFSGMLHISAVIHLLTPSVRSW